MLSHVRTATEPLFDLIAKLIGAGDQQKQLPVQGLALSLIHISEPTRPY